MSDSQDDAGILQQPLLQADNKGNIPMKIMLLDDFFAQLRNEEDQNGNVYHQKKSFTKLQVGIESLNSPVREHHLLLAP